jgi:hypothetical protein
LKLLFYCPFTRLSMRLQCGYCQLNRPLAEPSRSNEASVSSPASPSCPGSAWDDALEDRWGQLEEEIGRRRAASPRTAAASGVRNEMRLQCGYCQLNRPLAEPSRSNEASVSSPASPFEEEIGRRRAASPRTAAASGVSAPGETNSNGQGSVMCYKRQGLSE